MKRRHREILFGLLSLAPAAAALLLAIGLGKEFIDLGDGRVDSYYSLLGIRLGPKNAHFETIDGLDTLDAPAAALLALLPLHLASRGAADSDARLRGRATVRMAAVLICGLIFVGDLDDLLVYSPSGRGATRAELGGKVLTQVVAPTLGLLFLAGSVRDWLRVRRRSRRRRARSCVGCGYDLRGSPGGVCPECGTEVPKALSA